MSITTVEVTEHINKAIIGLSKLCIEINEFVQKQELPRVQTDYDMNLKIALAALAAEEIPVTVREKVAKGRIAEKYGFALECAKIKKWGLDKRHDAYRTIISARKAQYNVQDVI